MQRKRCAVVWYTGIVLVSFFMAAVYVPTFSFPRLRKIESIKPPVPSSMSTPSPPVTVQAPLCLIPRMEVDFDAQCSMDDLESTWGPLLARNSERMARVDSLPGEETRPFMLQSGLQNDLGACGSGCVSISTGTHRAAFAYMMTCNRLSRAVPDSRYCSDIVFHAFWADFPVNPHLPWFVLSFLLTQDLEYAQLWIWSRPGVVLESDPLLAPFVGHPLVKFKQFNGTQIIQSFKHIAFPETAFNERDGLYWLESDIFRVLILYAYGGVYTDIDFLFLRNLGPLLGREWFYQWGSHCDDMNGAVIRLFKNSSLGESILKHISHVPPQPGTTAWGRDSYAAINRQQTIPRYPTCFFNPAWLTGQDSFAGITHRNSWHGAFGFHLHGQVFSRGNTAEYTSDYASVKREMCAAIKIRRSMGLPGLDLHRMVSMC